MAKIVLAMAITHGPQLHTTVDRSAAGTGTANGFYWWEIER